MMPSVPRDEYGCPAPASFIDGKIAGTSSKPKNRDKGKRPDHHQRTINTTGNNGTVDDTEAVVHETITVSESTFAELECMTLASGTLITSCTSGFIDHWLPREGGGPSTVVEQEEGVTEALTQFQVKLSRLLYSCFAGANMAHIRVSFMELCENGKAPWVACRDADTVYINALWFKRDTAAALLGMTRPDSGKPAVSDSHLLFFATKLLFASALDRLPDATFGPGMYQYTHRHVSPSIQDQLMQLQNEPKHLRQLCVDRAISRIQNYLSLDGAVVLDEAHHDNRPAVRVSWFVGQYAGVGKDIAIQCHRTTCPIARSFLGTRGSIPNIGKAVRGEYVSAGKMRLDLRCLPCPRPSETLSPGNRCRPCQTKRMSSLATPLVVTDLEPGEQYLVVMVLDPDDKFAIANATALYTAPSDATPAVPIPAPMTSRPEIESRFVLADRSDSMGAEMEERNGPTHNPTSEMLDAGTQTIWADDNIIGVDGERDDDEEEDEDGDTTDGDGEALLWHRPSAFGLGNELPLSNMTGLEHLYEAVCNDGSVNDFFYLVARNLKTVVMEKEQQQQHQRQEKQQQRTRKRKVSLQASASSARRARQDMA